MKKGYLEILKNVLYEEDYDELIKMVDDQKRIKSVNPNAITGYKSRSVDYEGELLLQELYINLRYYLDKKGIYNSQIREGLAIVASKVAMMYATGLYASNIDYYFNAGELIKNCDFCNPCEEIVRLTLVASRDFLVDDDESNNKTTFLNALCRGMTNDEVNLEAIRRMLNGNKMNQRLSDLYMQSLLEELCEKLECVDLSSKISTRNNRETILEIFDQLTELNTRKLDLLVLEGSLTNFQYDHLITQYNDQTAIAARNMGLFVNTKVFKKEN